jgi:hypothetical protein
MFIELFKGYWFLYVVLAWTIKELHLAHMVHEYNCLWQI